MLFFVLFLIGRLNRNRNFSLKIIGIGTQKSISVGPYFIMLMLNYMRDFGYYILLYFFIYYKIRHQIA